MSKDRRVGQAERTQVLGLLGNAFEAGVLPVGDYDARVAAVGTATYASQLRLQVSDLPPAYAWGESSPAVTVTEPPAGAGRIALILGIASVPLSMCGVGLVLGLLAVIASRTPGRRRGVSAALIGRIFGVVGIALSLAALTAAFLAWRSQ